MRLRLPFAGSDALSESYAPLGQDLFVLMLLNGKRNGTFLEVGSFGACERSNTFLLEKTFGWSGTAVNDGKVFERHFRAARKGNLISSDPRRLPYGELFPGPIDYVSLSRGPLLFESLEAILSSSLAIAVLTFGHDFFARGTGRDESRELLEEEGFSLLVADISDAGECAEDWWAHPDRVDLSRASALLHGGPVDSSSFITGVECDD